MATSKNSQGRTPVPNGPSKTGKPSGGGRGNNPPKTPKPAPQGESK